MLRYFISGLTLTLALIQPAQAQVTVVTSIKPLQLIASAIQQDTSTVSSLLPPGASPHSFSLRPSDMRRLQQAELFYWIGPDLENFLPKVLQQRSKASVAIQDLAGLKLLDFDQAHTDDHDHQHGSLDTHLWLDPDNAKVIAQKIAADLSQLDPQQAAIYQANLEQFEQQLVALDTRIQQRLQLTNAKPFFVFHEAYNYLEDRYQLPHTGVLNLSSEVQAGARHLQQIRGQLEQAGASCLFYESPTPPKLAASLTQQLAVEIVALDPLATEIKVSPSGYIEFLDQLTATMASCLAR